MIASSYGRHQTYNDTQTDSVVGRVKVISTNCTRICNDTNPVLNSDMTDNLLVCGLWSTIATKKTYTWSSGTHAFPEADTLVERFNIVGLDAGDISYIFATVNTISFTINVMEQVTRLRSYEAAGCLYSATNISHHFEGV